MNAPLQQSCTWTWSCYTSECCPALFLIVRSSFCPFYFLRQCTLIQPGHHTTVLCFFSGPAWFELPGQPQGMPWPPLSRMPLVASGDRVPSQRIREYQARHHHHQASMGVFPASKYLIILTFIWTTLAFLNLWRWRRIRPRWTLVEILQPHC